MFYFRFVAWLIAKSDRWTTKVTWGDAGLYNHFETTQPNDLMQLFRLVIVLFFYGLPIFGVMQGIYALPISEGAQALVVFLLFLSIFIIMAVVLIRKATKKGVTKHPLSR